MRPPLFLLAFALSGVATVWAAPRVTLEAAPDREYYREGAASEVCVHTRIRIGAAEPNATPAVRNIAFVLDGSGSMAGPWADALRTATRAALEELAPDDFASLILFGSEVQTLAESQRRQALPPLDTLLSFPTPEGGAALYDALTQGAAQLRRQAKSATLNQLVLITDGPPTKGPREASDFTRLADALAAEGIQLLTVGIHADFSEDVLMDMARRTAGRFEYVDQPANLAPVLRALVGPPAATAATDAWVTLEFKRPGPTVTNYSWLPATREKTTVRFRLPPLTASREINLFVATELDGYFARWDHNDFATVRLHWTDPSTGRAEERTANVPIQFSGDTSLVREAATKGIADAITSLVLRTALQEAIEHLDRGSPRRALRTLRNARSDAAYANDEARDPRAAELIRQFDAYLARVQARNGLGPADRKLLRSGLQGVFEPAAPRVEMDGP